ncbi:MAG: barstar family protein [Lachnospiraceae bacterium]|nr:barstar family protein [Lachnospiraceae bacterium]
MKTILLDGLYMNTKEATHAYLAQRLHAPEYYGRNLDALHDILTDPCGETTLVLLYRKSHMLRALGRYGEVLLKVFRDSAAENPSLIFRESEE